MIFPRIIFSAEGDDFAKFLSLCRKNNINIRNFKKDKTLCFGTIYAKDYKKASLLGKSVRIRLKIARKKGIYFHLRKYKNRKGLLGAMAFFLVFLLFLQNFVWTIEINGNEKVKDSQILASGEKYGLKIGTFLPATDLEKIRLSMLLDIPSLSFISLNKRGSKIEIEVSEETPKPLVIDVNEPCNIVALKTAKILSSEVYKGQKMFKEGDTVLKGDLLVSGITETPDGKSVYCHALAKIKGETFFTKQISVKLNEEIISEEAAISVLEKAITDYEKYELKDAEIISREITAFTKGDVMFYKIDYRCIEDIVNYKIIETSLDPSLPTIP